MADAPARKKVNKLTRNPVEGIVERTINKAGKRRANQALPAALDSIAQIVPRSYLGWAFKQIDLKRKCVLDRGSEHSNNGSLTNSSHTSDTESTSSSLSASSTESSDSMLSGRSASKQKRDCAKKQRSTKSSDRRKVTLKPILPAEYNRSVDSWAFYWFITEGTAYIQDGNVA
ncbi:hypothetical protein DFH29DRAFT_872430 [Suillus ampliporus]|nr:hypothetical protein DFH29DRAFT_872430 [Suillus ampliporus]